MRIIYDDEKQEEMLDALGIAMNNIHINDVLREEWGMNRIQANLVYKKIEERFENYGFKIGNTVTHAHGIGNNCCYPVYYMPNDHNEIQQCGNININHGMYSECYVNCTDYDGKLISPRYELNAHGIEINGFKIR